MERNQRSQNSQIELPFNGKEQGCHAKISWDLNETSIEGILHAVYNSVSDQTQRWTKCLGTSRLESRPPSCAFCDARKQAAKVMTVMTTVATRLCQIVRCGLFMVVEVCISVLYIA